MGANGWRDRLQGLGIGAGGGVVPSFPQPCGKSNPDLLPRDLNSLSLQAVKWYQRLQTAAAKCERMGSSRTAVSGFGAAVYAPKCAIKNDLLFSAL